MAELLSQVENLDGTATLTISRVSAGRVSLFPITDVRLRGFTVTLDDRCGIVVTLPRSLEWMIDPVSGFSVDVIPERPTSKTRLSIIVDQREREDAVNHPKHYIAHPSGIECIEIVECMAFSLGNAIKYAWRAGLKSKSRKEDLQKCLWYLRRSAENYPKVQHYRLGREDDRELCTKIQRVIDHEPEGSILALILRHVIRVDNLGALRARIYAHDIYVAVEAEIAKEAA